jgi:hypothetical protein
VDLYEFTVARILEAWHCARNPSQISPLNTDLAAVEKLLSALALDMSARGETLVNADLSSVFILENLSRLSRIGNWVSALPHEPVRMFNLENYRSLLNATRTARTNDAKGSALEDLAEYIFLCVPGLNTIARNRRTLTEEIDIGVSNDAPGFWREIGNPFVVECKNVIAPVDATTIRNFRCKLQTKGLNGGFVVTTSHLTECGRIEIRQTLSERRVIVAVERKHLDAIACGRQIAGVLEERFYTCRLL